MSKSLFLLALALLSDTQTAGSVLCPDGFVAHGSSCYLFSHETATWADAVLTCQMLESSLVEIEDAYENTYLKNVVKGLNGDGWYIGATDKAVEGEFVWMDSKRSFRQTFTDWYPGEPGNAYQDESCVVIYNGIGYQWGDITCEARKNYICETHQSVSPSSAPIVG